MVFTGGLGDYGPPESVAASRLAQSLGVPEEDILIEQHSHSTRENVLYAKRIMDRYGWKKAIVVSDPYHLLRAVVYFEAVGAKAYPSPAKGVYRNRNYLLRFVYTAREVLLLPRTLVALVRGEL